MIEAESWLVVAPHPDDEVLGCGGTLALAAERGARVHVVVVFDGAAGDPEGRFERAGYVERRRREARAAGARLGLVDYSFWNLPEGHLASEHDLDAGARRLGALIDELRPDVVLAPWAGDDHPDHRIVARAVQRLIEHAGHARHCAPPPLGFWGFEVWSPLEPQHLVDVSTVWERKLDALRRHVTQLAYDDLAEKVTALATRHDAGLLEAFVQLEVGS